ncbi:Exporter protein, RND family [Olavius algarvensis associated proteobacterium Delta 3]|nr:Exporter protein, RND family [Olavius algarvensis associated proteobacterium Delta 3]CAB5158089.1 Exporter protein, RND family [Olavius algarvensis associated proteobacterium Delta 3]
MSGRMLKYLSVEVWLKSVLNKRAAVLLIIAAITLFFAGQIPNLKFSTSVYDLIIEDLPESAQYDAFKRIFGSDEIIRLVVKADNVFESATFAKLEQLSEAAAAIGGVRRIISLPEVRKAVDIGGKWNLEEFAGILIPVKLFERNLVSTDRKTTAITLVLNTDADYDQVIGAVEELISKSPADLSLYQIGMPLVSQALAQFTEKDFFRLPPVTFILIAVVLFLLFRSFRYLFFPLACVSLAMVWTFGLMALTGIPLSMLIMIVPVFLIAVGTAYCLHIVSACMAASKGARTQEEMVLNAFSSIGFPTILAVVTTIIGLGSLLLNRITAIQEFALFSCFGMVSLLVIVLTAFPAGLSYFPIQQPRKSKPGNVPGVIDRFLEWIVRIDLYHQKWTLTIISAVVVFCLIGIFQLRVETNPVDYFKADTPVSRHFHDIYHHLSGSFPINVTMSGPEEYYFESAENIANIARIQEYLDKLPGVDKTISFADYLKLVNYASNQFKSENYRLPEEAWEARMLINSYKTMLGEDLLVRFMKPDFSTANILLLTHLSSSREFLSTRGEILKFAGKEFPQDLSWEVTGFGVVISASSHLLTSGQVKSLSLTMVVVFGIMFLLFLSKKVGLIAVLPNLFPIVINFGIMGWLGVDLSMFTSLIASIAIGLAVDDTIHYMVRYNREFRKDLDDRRALRETILHLGKPIVFTTITISIGFAILTFSSFKPTAIFGAMMVITMLSALVGDLILLPSLMMHVELVTLWDLIRLKLGEEPREGIPLFSGLSRTQINYIIMAGSLKEFGQGEILFRKGDVSDSMYAVISGELEVLDQQTDTETANEMRVHKLIQRLGVGDVVGEMGLLRSVPRMATVVGKKPGELLQINMKMIRRLQWLFPPTAHRFFFNLMNILCDRLESATVCLTELSLEDDLTKFLNRRGFMKVLDAETYRAQRFQEDLTMLMLSVDFDRDILAVPVDTQDRLIRSICNCLVSDIRRCDTFGRLDIQTFALLMPRTPPDSAGVVCERLRSTLKKRRFESDGIRARVAIELTEVGQDPELSIQDLIQSASERVAGAERI